MNGISTPRSAVITEAEALARVYGDGMKSVPTPAAGAGVTGPCGYVRIGLQRAEAMRASQSEQVDEPEIAELENALGRGVRDCRLKAANWRNRVYQIECADGVQALAKQLVLGNDAMLRYQFEQLQRLASSTIPGLHVPQPFGLLPEKRVLVMEFAPGDNIQSLARTGDGVLSACDLAGKILARMHQAGTENVSFVPADLISADLKAAPWTLSGAESQILRRALERLSRASVRMGLVWYDYKPANLLFHASQLYLVDPPDTPWRGLLLWDFACFYSSMRRHVWRMSVRRPADHRQRVIMRQAMVAFERSYRSGFTERYPDPDLFMLTVWVLELQRTAVLMTMQRAFHSMRQGSPLAHRVSLFLLEIEKRWLFKQLAHELL